jgi:hypothetical protein
MTHARAASTLAALLSSVMLVACGGSSTKGAGGTSGGSGGKSGAGGTSGGIPKTLACRSSSSTMGTTCTQAELDGYSACFATACDPTFQMCYGPGYKSGQYSGPCGTYETCASKCACNDTACTSACGTTPTDCTSCLAGLLSCAFSCPLPACFTSGLGGSFGGFGGSFGGFGGSFGGFGGSFGGFGLGGSFGGLGLGGSSGSGTCLADGVACCNRAAAANQTACTTAYQAIAALGETACAAGLPTLKSTYCP